MKPERLEVVAGKVGGGDWGTDELLRGTAAWNRLDSVAGCEDSSPEARGHGDSRVLSDDIGVTSPQRWMYAPRRGAGSLRWL